MSQSLALQGFKHILLAPPARCCGPSGSQQAVGWYAYTGLMHSHRANNNVIVGHADNNVASRVCAVLRQLSLEELIDRM